MSSPNIGWLFYKGYYNTLSDDDYKFILLPKEEQNTIVKKEIEDKIEIEIKNILNQPPQTEKSEPSEKSEPLGSSQFEATTTYPGLLLGSGNTHELPDIKGQAILGFHFDYTSGLPIIQGSSVKGVLRSAFEHHEYIKEIIGDKDIEKLETEIFDNSDIFFDAVIYKASDKIFGDDYITPHGDNPLKDPTPLRFIKVMPNITFKFDFELSDGVLTKDEKLLLFAQILSDIGIGAKTNVGYGKFNSDLVSKTKNSINETIEARKKKEDDEKRQRDEDIKNEQLNAVDSNSARLEIELKELLDNREIFELIKTYTFNDDELDKIKKIVFEKIGAKPTKSKPAKRKWAIEIYKYFGK